MTKQLLNRGDLLEWLEISEATYRKWIEAKLLQPVKLKGIKKKWFRRADVIKALHLEGTL